MFSMNESLECINAADVSLSKDAEGILHVTLPCGVPAITMSVHIRTQTFLIIRMNQFIYHNLFHKFYFKRTQTVSQHRFDSTQNIRAILVALAER